MSGAFAGSPFRCFLIWGTWLFTFLLSNANRLFYYPAHLYCKRIAATDADDIPGDGGDSEIPDDAYDQEDQVTGVSGVEIRCAVCLDLVKVQLEHIDLDG